MVLPDSRGIPRAPRYSGTTEGRHVSFAYGAITHCGLSFQNSSTKDMFCNFPAARYCDQLLPHNTALSTRTGFSDRVGLGYCPFAHHYSGNRYYFLFLAVLRCFSSHRCPQQPMYSAEDTPQGGGLSHSEIPGSKCVCHSPRLIAAYHVLHRLPIPRHPPYTLTILKTYSCLDETMCFISRTGLSKSTAVSSRSIGTPAP
jgi:hypothetical protein